MRSFHVDEFGRMGAIGSTSATSAIVFPSSSVEAAPKRYLALGRVPTPPPVRLLPPKPASPVAAFASALSDREAPRTTAPAALLAPSPAAAKASPFATSEPGGSKPATSPTSSSSGGSMPGGYRPERSDYKGPATRPQVDASPTSSSSTGAGAPGASSAYGGNLDAYAPSYGAPSSADEASGASLTQAPSSGGAAAAPPAPSATGYYVAGGVLALAAGLGLYAALR